MTKPFSSRRMFLCGAAGAAGAWVAGKASRAAAKTRAPLPPDPERKLRFGLIGIGARCLQHIERIKKNSDCCEILALCDIREDRVKRGSALCDGKPAAYFDYRNLLAHAGVNCVLIATPHNLHEPMTLDALNAGFDVLVEKPMAITVGQCHAMNQAARTNNRVLMVAEQHRYFATNRKVKELIESGVIGRVQCVSARAFRGPWAASKRWLNFRATSGGALLSESCHDLDAFSWIVGSRPARVAGFGRTSVFPDQDTLDQCQLVYEFENGVSLSFGFGIFVPGGRRPIVILGSHGRLEYDRYGREITVYRYATVGRSAGQPTVVDLSKEMAETGHAGTDAMHEDFIRCVKGRLEPLTGGKVMVDCVRMALAGQEAVRRREVVHILDEFR